MLSMSWSFGDRRKPRNFPKLQMLLPGVRQLVTIGDRVEASELVQGALIDTGCPLNAPLPDGDEDGLPFALYNVSLEALLPEGLLASVHLTDVSDGLDGGEDEGHEEEEEQESGQIDAPWQRAAAEEDAYSGRAAPSTSGSAAWSDQSSAGAESEALLRRFADGVANAGIRVLGCQKRVAPAEDGPRTRT